ncbi:MAG: hypothetical protein AAGA32_09170 [Pseudomonadota bacterium]
MVTARRRPTQRFAAVAPALRARLDRCGTVVAMGESRSHLWRAGVVFTPCLTACWRWLEPGADLGVSMAAPAHPLMAGLGPAAVTSSAHSTRPQAPRC